jgi:predicted N-acetyltransferase YhbS
MVRAAQLDPTALHWSHFLMAEVAGEVVGIGQIRPATPELGSLVVLPEHQGQGIGARLIRELLARWSGKWPVYLECEGKMVPYYERFGFREIQWHQAPFPLKLKSGIGALLGPLAGVRIAVMTITKRGHTS